jgi:hypothetical protein
MSFVIRPVTDSLLVIFFLSLLVFTLGTYPVEASDHLDTRTVIADPTADIGDLYAWISSDGHRLNLVMTIVGKRFSDRIEYVFHVDSGKRFGETTASTSIICQFDTAGAVECWAGKADYVRGDASKPVGLSGEKRGFQVFAGLRDDPFFNNVKGTRAAFNVAAEALRQNAKSDAAGCPDFDEATSRSILDRWRHTEGGPAKNFLEGWITAALIISVDLNLVNSGGEQLAVWAGTYKMPDENKVQGKSRPALGDAIDLIGRPLVVNMLIGTLDPDEVRDARREKYNRSGPPEWSQFSADIQRTLGLFDGYDRTCGNQWLANREARPEVRYQTLAKVLADDRIWINSKSSVCTQFLAVELSKFTNTSSWSNDCGGRTPNYNANAIFRSLLVRGTIGVVDDGIERDDAVHSTSIFPFLAPPSDARNNEK